MLLRTARHWPEADTSVTKLVNRLFRLRDLILEESAREMARFELSPVEFAVLSSLRKLAPPREMRPSELYNAMVVTSGGMTKILKNLETRQLVKRLPDPTDGRSVRIRLSESGATLIEEALATVQASQAAMLAKAADSSAVARLADSLAAFTSTLDR
ncbi:MarR family transcriptional regulator [Methylonatrum kenyense]|uniref:MarR family winged helix-turn-helix transcriptional regulator n=1 Tax=Methylonatrum kenyense TaxID=455253 RepID=UPI0020C0FDC2|nr:MarR family transcriptional regulator [Methylonatrum kenyense]MCK8515074.1 MarR family transcriptional regulator [Methylonatrum kenyense]